MGAPTPPTNPGVPTGYTEGYYIPVGKRVAYDAAITLDTSVTGADVVVYIDGGFSSWTVLANTTADFVAGVPNTLYNIFKDYVYWDAEAPTGVRQLKVLVMGGTPVTDAFELYTSFEVCEVPVISGPAISAASIAQDESVTITSSSTGSPAAGWVDVLDDDGAVVYSQDVLISEDDAVSCSIHGRHLPAAEYVAGQIKLYLVDSTGTQAAMDASLALTVTASASPILIRATETLRALIQDDERFSDIADEDVIIAAHPNEVGKVMGNKAIILIPLGLVSEESTCRLDENTLTIWAVCVVYDSRTDREDYQPLEDVETIMSDIKKLVREQDDDPDERLSGLAQSLHATSIGDEDMSKRGGTALVGYTEITVTVMTDENGDPQ